MLQRPEAYVTSKVDSRMPLACSSGCTLHMRSICFMCPGNMYVRTYLHTCVHTDMSAHIRTGAGHDGNVWKGRQTRARVAPHLSGGLVLVVLLGGLVLVVLLIVLVVLLGGLVLVVLLIVLVVLLLVRCATRAVPASHFPTTPLRHLLPKEKCACGDAISSASMTSAGREWCGMTCTMLSGERAETGSVSCKVWAVFVRVTSSLGLVVRVLVHRY